MRAVLPTGAVDVGGGAGTEGGVASAVPVEKVVPALLAGDGVVADLVRGLAGLSETLARVVQHFELDQILRRDELAQTLLHRDGRVGFVGEAVARKVWRVQRDRRVKRS